LRSREKSIYSLSKKVKRRNKQTGGSNIFIRKIILIYFATFILPYFFFVGPSFSEKKIMGKGSLLPVFTFQNTLSKEENMYLGLSRKDTFPLEDIQAKFLIIEVFSTYCMSCPKNVPVLNKVYSAIENDPGLKGKVKIAGIGVGNTENEIKTYRKAYRIKYPVLADYSFAFHKVIGNPRVPYTIFMKRIGGGKKSVIFNIHQGVLDSPEGILQSVKDELHDQR
jgi:hypothetical protein